MPKYRKPGHSVTEEPTFFIKHYWRLLVEYTTKHRDTVITGLLVAAVVFFGFIIWRRYRENSYVDAWHAVGTAGNVTELESAVLRYVGTPAESFLRLRLGDTYVLTGESAKALDVYSWVAATAGGEMAGRARYSMAFAQEALDKFADAAKTFEGLAAQGGFWGRKASEALQGQESRRAAHAQLQALRKESQAKKEAALDEAAEAETTAGEKPSPDAEDTQGTMESRQAGQIPSGPESEDDETEENETSAGGGNENE